MSKASDRRLSDTLSARSYLDPGQAPRLGEPSEPARDDMPLRKRGRPRLEPTDKAPDEDRRSQVRRAQRAYRQKKDATVRSLRTRVADLETTLQNVSDIFANFQDAVDRSDLGLAPNDPVLLSDIVDRIMGEIENSGFSTGWQNQNPSEPIPGPAGNISRPFFKQIKYMDRSLHEVFGYQVSHQVDDDDEAYLVEHETVRKQHVPSFLSSSILDSIFSGSASSRPNLQAGDPDRVDPRFIVCALGLLRSLPDSAVGIFGPDRTDVQDLKAILERIMASVLGVDCEKPADRDWVDCRDVRTYLEEKRIVLDRSSVLVDIPMETVLLLQGECGADTYEYADRLDYFLDMESFLSCIVERVRFLGCAPGFRKTDIKTALKSAMRRRP